MPLWDDVEIVSADQARQHARISEDEWSAEEDDFTLKLLQAHALVLDAVLRPNDEDHEAEMLAWDEDSAPRAIQAAIMRQFKDLVRFRGDDEDLAGREDGNFLSPRVRQLLNLYRDPPLA